MLRIGDTVGVIEGLDEGKKCLVVDVNEDFITCSTLEGDEPFNELSGIIGEYTFNVNNLKLLIPIIQPKDKVVVRESTLGGKKNVNVKARPGMKGVVVDVTKHFSTVDFGEGDVFRLGTKLLDRESFVSKKPKIIKVNSGDIIVYKLDDKRGVGKVRTVTTRETVITCIDGNNILVPRKNISRRIRIKDMIKKAVVSNNVVPTNNNSFDEELPTKKAIDKKALKDELRKLYEDELNLSKIKNLAARNSAKQTISNLIRDTLSQFHSTKKMICFPGGKPFNMDSTITRGTSTIRKRKDRIKEEFFKYLQWKMREMPKLMVQEVSTLFDFKLKKSGNVNAEPGQYIKFKQYLEEGSLIEMGKSPGKLKGNYIGIEVECYVTTSHRELKEALVEAGLSRYVDVTTDGSLRPDEELGQINTELRVLVKESMYSEVLQALLNVVHDHGGSVNHACGIHVHLDMRNRNANQCYSRLYSSLPHLFSAVAAERRSNQYCIPNQSRDLAKQSKWMTDRYGRRDRHRRYAAINTLSVEEHSTLEVRILEGSIDHRTICHWIATLVSIVNTDVQRTEDVDDFLSQLTNYTDEQRGLFRQRVEQYATTEPRRL